MGEVFEIGIRRLIGLRMRRRAIMAGFVSERVADL